MNGFQGFLRALGMGRMVGIAIGGLVSFALIYFLMAQMGGTPMTPLLFGLSQEDSARIQTELQQRGVEFRAESGGGTIFVDEEQADNLRLFFAGEGIGTGSVVGYELFDKSETLGSTSFVQNVNRVRALEGELTRTIMSLNSIQSARVHITIAKRQLFQRNREEAKATVVLRSRGGSPDNNTVRSIQHIVANSVAGLSPSNVTVADETGGLLASGNTDLSGAGGNGTIDEKVHALEERTRQKVVEILSGIIPLGKARVQVQAEIQREEIVENSRFYDPDAQVTTRITNRETSQENIDSEGVDKPVSVANSLPGGGLNAEVVEEGPKKKSSSRNLEEDTSFLNSFTERNKKTVPGEIKRLSIAVIVDGNYAADANGNSSYTPRSADELGQLTELIKGAVGYDEERGDTIVVQSMEFAAVEMPDGVADDGSIMGFSNAQLVEVLKTLIIGAIVLLLTLLVIRPLMKAVLTPSAGGQLALAGAGGVPVEGDTEALPAQQPIAGQLAAPADATAPPPSPGSQTAIESHIDIAKVEGEVQATSLKKVGEIVENHPDETVAIIRNWLHNEE